MGRDRPNNWGELTVEADRWQTPSQADTTGGHLSRSKERSGEMLLKGQAKQWVTPQQHDGAAGPGTAGRIGHGGRDLVDQTQAWATPAARDWKSDDPNQSPEHSPPLGRQVLRATGPASKSDSGPRRLNPASVEWLMGLPPGWTACEPVETESFRRWRRWHSRR